MEYELNIIKKERNGMSDFSKSLMEFLISFPISQELVKRLLNKPKNIKRRKS